jgi:hypothetical protein
MKGFKFRNLTYELLRLHPAWQTGALTSFEEIEIMTGEEIDISIGSLPARIQPEVYGALHLRSIG